MFRRLYSSIRSRVLRRQNKIMASQQLIDYIKQRFTQGATKTEIRESLFNNGWVASDIEEGFQSIESPIQPAPPVQKVSPMQQPVQPIQPIMPDQSAAQPTEPFSTFSAQTPNTKSRLPFVVIAVIGLFLIGGGAFAYYYFNTPQMVMKRMMKAESKIQSVEYQGSISVEMTGEGALNSLLGQQGKMTINFSGSSDIKDASNSKTALYLDMTAAGSSLFALDMRQIDKILYLKVADASMLEMLDLGAVIGQWIKIDAKELENQLGFEDLGKNLDQELTPEKIAKINKIFETSEILKVIEKMSDEKIEGADTRHYKLVISQDKLKKLLIDLSLAINDTPLTAEEIQQLDEDFKGLKSVAGEVWVGKKDLLLRKLSLNVKGKQQDPSLGEIGVAYDVNVLLRNYNKPVQIEVPSPVKSFEEVFGPLFMNTFQGSTTAPGVFY